MRKRKVRGLTAFARIPELLWGRTEIKTWGHLFSKLTASSVMVLGTFPRLSFSGGERLSKEEELEKEYSRPEIMLVWPYQVNIKYKIT